MLGLGKTARNKNGLKALTVITDCLSRCGKTPFPLRGWGAMIEEYNVKTKNKDVMCDR
jgi:hypothetical protein